jgi:hypothetical protein
MGKGLRKRIVTRQQQGKPSAYAISSAKYAFSVEKQFDILFLSYVIAIFISEIQEPDTFTSSEPM